MLHNFSPHPAIAYQCFWFNSCIHNPESITRAFGFNTLTKYLGLTHPSADRISSVEKPSKASFCIILNSQHTFAPIQFQRENSSRGTREQSVLPMASLP